MEDKLFWRDAFVKKEDLVNMIKDPNESIMSKIKRTILFKDVPRIKDP